MNSRVGHSPDLIRAREHSDVTHRAVERAVAADRARIAARFGVSVGAIDDVCHKPLVGKGLFGNAERDPNADDLLIINGGIRQVRDALVEQHDSQQVALIAEALGIDVSRAMALTERDPGGELTENARSALAGVQVASLLHFAAEPVPAPTAPIPGGQHG